VRVTTFPMVAVLAVLASAAFAQTDAPKGYTGAYAPAGNTANPIHHRSITGDRYRSRPSHR
jgi:hypothetical protein